jgi:hypothetical protein
MTDTELLEAQHRLIVMYTPCTCGLAWRHGDELPLCPKCKLVKAYDERKPS